MPAIDLRGLLGPIVQQVAATVFPTTVAIERPVRTQDDAGDPIDTWEDVDADVPAVIEPLSNRTAAYFPNVPTESTDVSILLAGDRDIQPEYRIREEYVPTADPDPRAGDRWDVVGVSRDPARATTIILGRRRRPGTPDEGS
jgi:head-tail adaptor